MRTFAGVTNNKLDFTETLLRGKTKVMSLFVNANLVKEYVNVL